MADVRDLFVWRQSSPLRCRRCERLVFRNGQWAIINEPSSFADALLVCGACWGEISYRGALAYMHEV